MSRAPIPACPAHPSIANCLSFQEKQKIWILLGNLIFKCWQQLKKKKRKTLCGPNKACLWAVLGLVGVTYNPRVTQYLGAPSCPGHLIETTYW